MCHHSPTWILRCTYMYWSVCAFNSCVIMCSHRFYDVHICIQMYVSYMHLNYVWSCAYMYLHIYIYMNVSYTYVYLKQIHISIFNILRKIYCAYICVKVHVAKRIYKYICVYYTCTQHTEMYTTHTIAEHVLMCCIHFTCVKYNTHTPSQKQ